jgi:radical SAM protein with 4Fe4S-binding SPASM domain
MLNVSSLTGVRSCASDALRYGWPRAGENVPAAATSRRPVVVWNVTRACNLACAHCYASALASPGRDELTTAEGEALLDDLAAFGVPAVLLSGGEPLVRPDLLHLAVHGRRRGLRFTLSSNGTLLDRDVAASFADAGVVYVGVSIDGAEATHDRLRRRDGAWRGATAALDVLADAGVKRGLRFTLTPDTAPDLDAVLDLAAAKHVERLCLYHLVPAGRGRWIHDVTPAQRRAALERVFTFAIDHPELEVLTVDNPADGAALYRWLLERDLDAAARCRAGLEWNRGAAAGAGIGLAAVDARGDIHLDQFSAHRTLGNVRERRFSEVWMQTDDPFVRAVRAPDPPLPERCHICPDLPLCGGGFRTRAEAATGDPWGFDPSCSRPAEAAA